MSNNTIDEWIREENGHQASDVDQVLTAYWFYRNGITVNNDVDRRTAEVKDALEERLDHEVETVLENLAEIGVLEKKEPPTRVFIQNERTGDAFFSPTDEDFPPNLYREISRLVYDIHLQEGQGDGGAFPQRLSRPTLTPATDGGDVDPETDNDDSLQLRQFVATELDAESPEVEQALVAPDDTIECMEQFDDLVTAIKKSDEVVRGLDYDQVGWRHRANRWTLSKTAQRVEVNESLPV